MSQVQKSQLEKSQLESQMYLNEACGRILAEAEELIKTEFPRFQDRHANYLAGEDQSRVKRMANIQMFLKSFQVYCQDNKAAASEKLHIVSVPHPGEATIKDLMTASKQVKDQTLKKILGHLAVGFDSGTLDRFPEDLSEEILSSQERTRIIKDMVQNKQSEILQLHFQGQQLTSTIDKNLAPDTIKPGKQMIPHQPLINTKALGPNKPFDPRA